jgi:hypothetical protein
MMGIEYFKAAPTEYARLTVNGKVKRKGVGISALYIPFRTTIELMSATQCDQAFTFKEKSNDNQELSFQGTILYTIQDYETTLKSYNFAVQPRSKTYLSEGPEKLAQHILQIVKANTQKIIQTTNLEKLVVMNEELARSVQDQMKTGKDLETLGISLQHIFFSYINPKPEIAKALESTYRETLLQQEDKAIHQRRELAVDNNRVIREKEVQTDIEIEMKRKELVEQEGKNILQRAEYNAQAATKEFSVFGKMDPATITAHGFYLLGKNAERIENLSVTPEIVAALLQGKRSGGDLDV